MEAYKFLANHYWNFFAVFLKLYAQLRRAYLIYLTCLLDFSYVLEWWKVREEIEEYL